MLRWSQHEQTQGEYQEIFVDFIEISLDKCCVADSIELGIQTSIRDGLSNNLVTINMSNPEKDSLRLVKFVYIIITMDKYLYLLASVRPMVPVPQNRSSTISEPFPL